MSRSFTQMTRGCITVMKPTPHLFDLPNKGLCMTEQADIHTPTRTTMNVFNYTHNTQVMTAPN